jgi:hypothetical protein
VKSGQETAEVEAMTERARVDARSFILYTLVSPPGVDPN